MKKTQYLPTGLLAFALLSGAAMAQEGKDSILQIGPPYFPGAALLTLVLVTAHLFAPQLGRLLNRSAAQVGSFGGGMAAAYAFLHLIPELNAGHELLGKMIYVVPLAGFVFYYALERRFHLKGEDAPNRASKIFAINLTSLCLYNFLIVYGTPESGDQTGWRTSAIVLALVLHLIHADFGFGRTYARPFFSFGRYALVGSVLLGYAAILFEKQAHEGLMDLSVAFLSGSVLFNVFREEVPQEKSSRIGWFILGIVFFAAATAITAA